MMNVLLEYIYFINYNFMMNVLLEYIIFLTNHAGIMLDVFRYHYAQDYASIIGGCLVKFIQIAMS